MILKKRRLITFSIPPARKRFCALQATRKHPDPFPIGIRGCIRGFSRDGKGTAIRGRGRGSTIGAGHRDVI